MTAAGSIFVDLLLRDSNYQQGFARVRRTTSSSANVINRDLQTVSVQFRNLVNPINSVTTAVRNLAAISGAAFSVQGIVRYADTYKQLSGRLSIVETDAAKLVATQEQLFEIAQRNRTPLEGVVNFYQRLNQFIPQSVRAQYDLLGVTENVTAALAITGETSISSTAALVQFTQAIGTNFEAAGQELRTLQEQAPRLAQALQNALGDGTKSLQTLKKEGLLTRDSVLRALSGAGEEGRRLAEELAKVPLTVGQAFIRLDNAFLKFIGQNKLINEGTSSLAAGITALANNLDVLANAVIALSVISTAIFTKKWRADLASAAASQTQLYSAVLKGDAVLLNSSKAAALKASAEVEASRASIIATENRIAALRQESAQYATNIALINKQRKADIARAELSRGLAAINMGGGTSETLNKVRNDSLRAQIVTTRALSVAEKELTAQNAILAASQVRLASATAADTLAKQANTLASKTLAATRTGLLALTGLVGGPLSAAMLAAGAAVFYLSTRTSELEKAQQLNNETMSEVIRLSGIIETGTARQAEAAEKAREIKVKETIASINKTRALIEENKALSRSYDLYATKFGQTSPLAGQNEARRKELESFSIQQAKVLNDLLDEIYAPRNFPKVPPLPNGGTGSGGESEAEKRQKRLNDLNNKYKTILTGLDAETLRYTESLNELVELKKLSGATDEQLIEWQKRLRQEYEDTAEKVKDKNEEMSVFAKRAAENIQDAFADFLFDPFESGLDGMLKGFVDTTRRMIAEAAAAKLAQRLLGDLVEGGKGEGALGGIFSGALGGIFDGFFADGGYIKPGHFGVAGEAGAEMLYGGRSGVTVMPMTGAGGNTYNIDARGADQGAVNRLETALLTLAGPGVIERRVNNGQRRGMIQ